jgi:hypothetical protein
MPVILLNVPAGLYTSSRYPHFHTGCAKRLHQAIHYCFQSLAIPGKPQDTAIQMPFALIAASGMEQPLSHLIGPLDSESIEVIRHFFYTIKTDH